MIYEYASIIAFIMGVALGSVAGVAVCHIVNEEKKGEKGE